MAVHGRDGGRYDAFLHGPGGGSPYARLGRSEVPWARPDGVVVVPAPTGFLDTPASAELVAPLANASGVTFFVGSPTVNCVDWTVDGGAQAVVLGNAWESGVDWDQASNFGRCWNTTRRLACFER